VKPVKRRWIRRILISTGVLFLLVLAAVLSIPTIFAPERRATADVILHLASDARLQGDEYVVRLFREGLSRSVICASSPASWDLYAADASKEHLIELGVPADAISVLHLPITECGAETVPLLINALSSRGAKSALLVVDPTATRYGEWRARQRFSEAGITVFTTFEIGDRERMLDQWWRSHWKAQRVVGVLMNSTLDLMYASCR
jgi:hypothetical protein